MGLVYFLASHLIISFEGLANNFLKRQIFLKKKHGLCALVFLISAYNPILLLITHFLLFAHRFSLSDTRHSFFVSQSSMIAIRSLLVARLSLVPARCSTFATPNSLLAAQFACC